MLLLYFLLVNATLQFQETGACIDDTLAQSPIQLKPPFSHIELNLEFDFLEAKDIYMKHTGNELIIQGTFGFLKHGGKVFNVYQVKFKSPSEHSLSENDYFYPLEMQIFLISQQKYKLGLIVFFKVNKDHIENSLLAKFGFGKNIIKDLSPGDVYLIPEPLNLGVLFEDTDPFLVYQGSETSPPCGQMVWLILFKFYSMSSNQAVDFPETLLYQVREQKEMKRPIYANFDPTLFVITDGDLNTKEDLKKQRQRHQVDKKLVKDNFQIIGGDLELDSFVFAPAGTHGGKVVRTEDYFIIKVKPEPKDPQSEGQEDIVEEEAPKPEEDIGDQSIPEEFIEEIMEELGMNEEKLVGEDQEEAYHEEGGQEQVDDKKLDLHQRIKERQASKANEEIKRKKHEKQQQKKQQEQDKQKQQQQEQQVIQYNDWPRLCQVGKSQSPIILNPKQFIQQNMNHPALEYAIIPNEIYFSHDGYQLKLITDSKGFGVLKWNGILYQANEINFHTPSEHLIGTEQFKSHCEIQIVHKSLDNKILVLVLFLHNTYSTDRNSFLEQIGIPSTRSINYRAVEKGELVQINRDIRLSELVSYVTDFINYTGSLSTPPCIENVQYIIRRNRLPIAEVQLENMKRLIGYSQNARPIQNLNGRSVYMN